MSGFNWLKWISKVASSQKCPRSRRARNERSSHSTEALEHRLLLSATSLVPQSGTDSNDAPGDVPNVPPDASSTDGSSTDKPATDDNAAGDQSDSTVLGDESPDDDGSTTVIVDHFGSIQLGTESENSDGTDSTVERTVDGSADDSNAESSSDDDLSTDDNGNPIILYSLFPGENQALNQQDIQFDLPENSAVSTLVGTITSMDPDANADVNYVITSGNDNGAFSINVTTGQIFIANSSVLDYESLPTTSFTVEITDNSTSSYSGTADVTVNLTNVNEAPVMSDSNLSVPENSADQTVVGDVFASDPDVGSAFQFAITGGNSSGAFAIDAYTGRVSVANGSLLNYESRPDYFLTVQVADNGTPPLSTSASLLVHLTNVDDPPIVSMGSIPPKFAVGNSAVRFGEKAIITDEDTPVPVFTGTVLSVSITDNRSNKDILSVKDSGSKSKKIAVHGQNIVYGHTIIGTWEGGKGADQTLRITLNSSANKTNVEALVHALSFSTKDTSLGTRTLNIQLSDSTGANLSATSRSIQMKKPHKVNKLAGWGFY